MLSDILAILLGCDEIKPRNKKHTSYKSDDIRDDELYKDMYDLALCELLCDLDEDEEDDN